ncbi:MAG: Ldh family oxidoreductase [Cyclobacteriaceae bacterium]
MKSTFLELGLNAISTDHAVNSMIQTSLRGVDSHGINLFPHYCRAIQSGRISQNPDFKISQDKEAAATLDADHAIGHHAGIVAVEKCIEMANSTGIGAVGVKNSTHFGAAAYFSLFGASKNLITFAFTNADALVKAHNSKSAYFGTNPICMAAPMKNEQPFILDMATSIVSWNKVKNYQQEGLKLPLGWACDESGIPVTDPHLAKSLNPTGLYKGFGLGMIVDILCSLLASGPISRDILPMFTSPILAKRKIGHFFIAINISSFVSVQVFKERLQDMADQIRSLPNTGNDSVMIPGDPEKKSLKVRSQEGIPIEDLKFKEFISINEDFALSLKNEASS